MNKRDTKYTNIIEIEDHFGLVHFAVVLTPIRLNTEDLWNGNGTAVEMTICQNGLKGRTSID